MIKVSDFYNILIRNNINFFCGIPDSLLKAFCGYITNNISPSDHIITANEGNAIALASGYHLVTGGIPLVYMQNSGLGNTVNPLISLTSREVYSIPMLLIIGWRGEPNINDEPQHIKQGSITLNLLNTLDINYTILSDKIEDAEEDINKAIKLVKKESTPYAIIVKKNIFEKYDLFKKRDNKLLLTRERAIQLIANSVNEMGVIISTTGKASRELYEHRARKRESHKSDFLTVGSMGHASSIALGISIKTKKNVYCIDGDGAAIMHLGAMTSIGQNAGKNFKHIIINNGAHESVGGQPTVGFEVDICTIAKACGYKSYSTVSTENELINYLKKINNLIGPVFLEVKVNTESRNNLGRPKTTPTENKNEFIDFIR